MNVCGLCRARKWEGLTCVASRRLESGEIRIRRTWIYQSVRKRRKIVGKKRLDVKSGENVLLPRPSSGSHTFSYAPSYLLTVIIMWLGSSQRLDSVPLSLHVGQLIKTVASTWRIIFLRTAIQILAKLHKNSSRSRGHLGIIEEVGGARSNRFGGSAIRSVSGSFVPQGSLVLHVIDSCNLHICSSFSLVNTNFNYTVYNIAIVGLIKLLSIIDLNWINYDKHNVKLII